MPDIEEMNIQEAPPATSKKEDFQDGMFIWTEEFRTAYYLKVRFVITALLYTAYFFLFFIRCSTCYSTKHGITTFVTIVVYLLLRYWQLTCEQKKNLECCTKGPGICTCSRISSIIQIIIAAFILWGIESEASAFNYFTDPPKPGYITTYGKCTRFDHFVPTFFPCYNVYVFPFFLLGIDLLFKLIPPSWDFKSLSAARNGKILSFVFSFLCLLLYVSILSWMTWNTMWDNFYLAISAGILTLLQLWSLYVVVTGKCLFVYCCLTSITLPLLFVVAITALFFHYEMNCDVPLIHMEFVSREPRSEFGLDWEVWTAFGVFQLIHFLLLTFGHLRGLSQNQLKCLQACFFLTFFPVLIVTACGYVCAGQVVLGCRTCMKNKPKRQNMESDKRDFRYDRKQIARERKFQRQEDQRRLNAGLQWLHQRQADQR